jgi:hypothetical protein
MEKFADSTSNLLDGRTHKLAQGKSIAGHWVEVLRCSVGGTICQDLHAECGTHGEGGTCQFHSYTCDTSQNPMDCAALTSEGACLYSDASVCGVSCGGSFETGDFCTWTPVGGSTPLPSTPTPTPTPVPFNVTGSHDGF